MILGIGIDIVEIERIALIINRQPGFIERIFTVRERELLPEQAERKAEYVAGRFAAKEAAAKAVGTGICSRLSFQDIEIVRTESGKPAMHIASRVLAEQYPGKQNILFHLSISHSKDYAVANVMIEQV
jgi:holo-[acyl-carrier protein] synthase